ncbi:MAG: hypothetical protein ACRCXC_00615 [Legionella sp.]
MPYLVKGNAQQVFHAFGQDWAIEEKKDDAETIAIDFQRTHFLGTQEQAKKHFSIWHNDAIGTHYLQGNMSAGNLWTLLGPRPLMKKENDPMDPRVEKEEDPEIYHHNFVRQHFAYVNDSGETCGFMVMYRKDDPAQWMMGYTKNGHLASKDREVAFLSSFDLQPFIKVPDTGISVSSVSFAESPLQQLGSDFANQLVAEGFDQTSNTVNIRFQRADLLARSMAVAQETVTLDDALVFDELNLSALFADNLALDLLIAHTLPDDFSFALLKDLLSEPSQVRKEIESFKLTADPVINKNLIKITIKLYESGLLATNRKLLDDLDFVKKFGGSMWDGIQISLIPFLREKKYDEDLIHLILSEPAYFCAVNQLVQLEKALTQDIPEFFKDPMKLAILKVIHQLPNEDCKKTCLIFWIKSSLTEDGYKPIIETTERYPLLASTLVALDQTKNIIDIDELRALVSNPQHHLQESIIYHFNEKLTPFNNVRTGLRKLNVPELDAASVSLSLLKKSNVTEPRQYYLVLDKGQQGQALRLFLPQLAKESSENRKVLLEVLYAGVQNGIQTQGNKVLAITNPEQLALAKKLRERFMCVTQLQGLDSKKDMKEMVELAALEESAEAERFRQVILRVEAQFKIISERLSGSISYRKMSLKWNANEARYRKRLYKIAFDGFMEPETDVRGRLLDAEKSILLIVDPEIDSKLYKFIYNTLVAIANIIISLCSFGLANVFKYRNTGNPWFFNQTRSGEEIRALDKELFALIETEDDEDAAEVTSMELN